MSALVLQIVRGDTHVLTERTTIGRKGDIILDDEYASPEHCALYPVEDHWVVEDLGSTNGTWIQHPPLRGMFPAGTGREVRKGDHLRIGSTKMILVPAL